MKPKIKKSKRKKLNLKEYNIDALEINIRKNSNLVCPYADIIKNPRRYRKRHFRKEDVYLSR